MAPLRPLAYREVRRKLMAAGFAEASRKGSHVKFVKTEGAVVRTAIVPAHREVSTGTLRSILRQAGLSTEEFEQL
ncbi:MAG: type II toxin-antitoxin system HicA family toxin [Alphaproteobacteria bacterium]